MMQFALLDEVEAADLLRTIPSRVMRMARRGEIPHVRLPGGEIRFVVDDLREWVDTIAYKPPTVQQTEAATQ
jgi:excisionase family DNA binding protein